jgi:DNA-binding IclR family transcriptional regulator
VGEPVKRQSHPGRSVEDPKFNVALARGLEVLRAFRPGDIYLGNSELAERTGIPPSTISRFTHTLCKLGYLHFVDTLGCYQLGFSVLDLGFGAMRTIDPHVLARPLLADLALESGAVVSFAVMEGDETVHIEVARAHAPISSNVYPGQRAPVADSCVGWACVAALAECDRLHLHKRLQAALGDEWSTIHKRFTTAARELEQAGFCIESGSPRSPWLNAAAVPVSATGDRRRFALSISGPSSFLSRAALRNTWAPRLVDLALRLQAELPRPRGLDARPRSTHGE